jgi:hypothetical protein
VIACVLSLTSLQVKTFPSRASEVQGIGGTDSSGRPLPASVSPGILPHVHGLAQDPALPCSALSSSALIQGPLLARDAIEIYAPA